MILQNQMDAVREWFERLSQRERTLVGLLGVVTVVLIAVIGGFVISQGLTSMEEENDAIRQALHDISEHGGSYLQAKAKLSQLESRFGAQPLQLGGYLEQAAKEAGLEIAESNERAPVSIGGRYSEHSTELRIQKVRIEALAEFLKKVESGPNLVVITSLNVRTRDDRHEELEVEIEVSSYERASKEKAKKGDKS